MPWKNQNFWEWLYDVLSSNAIYISSFLLAAVISIFSTARKYGKVDWLEALICGLLTLTVASILSWFNLPNQAAIFAGGFIGFKGSKWVDQKFNEQWDRKSIKRTKDHED